MELLLRYEVVDGTFPPAGFTMLAFRRGLISNTGTCYRKWRNPRSCPTHLYIGIVRAVPIPSLRQRRMKSWSDQPPFLSPVFHLSQEPVQFRNYPLSSGRLSNHREVGSSFRHPVGIVLSISNNKTTSMAK
jgi:hypothetical protein